MSRTAPGEELKAKALGLVQANRLAVSVEFVAKKLGVSWGTARNLLLELALDGKVAAEKTTKAWVFRKNVQPKEREG